MVLVLIFNQHGKTFLTKPGGSSFCRSGKFLILPSRKGPILPIWKGPKLPIRKGPNFANPEGSYFRQSGGVPENINLSYL